MCKKVVLLAFVCVTLAAITESAEAKLIRYEIDGKRYSYSTNNIQQTREARARIEAAAARARAAAEGAQNPLKAIFGSPAQREAAAAEARLQQVVVPQQQAEINATSSVKRSHKGRSRVRAEVRRERRHPRWEARLERQKVQMRQAERAARRAAHSQAAPNTAQAPGGSVPQANPVFLVPAIGAPQAAPTSPGASPNPPVLARDNGSLTDFVNRVRKAPHEDPPPRL